MSICAKPECPEVATDHGRCRVHRREVVGTGSRGSTSAQRKRRRRILERDNWTCHYCGAQATTEDHLIPVTRGGSDEDSNLVAACAPCNSSKGGKTADEFIAWRKAR